MYYLFFLLPFAAGNVYLQYNVSPSIWNMYMLEAVIICLIDFIFYLIAFCELLNFRKLTNKQTSKYEE